MPRTTTRGVLRFEDGRYYIEAGKAQHDIPPAAVDAEALEPLIDQEVELLFTKPQRYLLAIQPPDLKTWPKCFICYVPPDDPWRKFTGIADEVIRERFVKHVFQAGIIDEVTRDKLLVRRR